MREGCISSASLRQGSPGTGTGAVAQSRKQSVSQRRSRLPGAAPASRAATSLAFSALPSQPFRGPHWSLPTQIILPEGATAEPAETRTRGPLLPSSSTVTARPAAVP